MDINSEQEPPEGLNQSVLSLQIICASLVAGVVIFGAFTLIQSLQAPQKQPNLTIYAFAEAMIVLPLCFILPKLIGMSQRPQTQINSSPETNSSEPGRMTTQSRVARLQIQKIIQYAMLEGSAFFNLIAYYLEHHYLGLVAVGIILFIMVMIFPTHSSVTQWLRRQDELAGFDESDPI